MNLAEKEFKLNDAGFSQKEIADWKKQKIQKLNGAGFNNQEILLNCLQAIKEFFNIDKWQIGQPIIKTEVFNVLTGITGVQSVQSVIFNNKSGESLGYSKYKYDLQSATIDDIIYPSLDPCIFEVKYPNTDIKGQIIT